MAGKDGMSDEQPDIPPRAHSDGRFLVKLFLARILLPGMALLCLRRVFLCLRCIPGSESVAARLRGNPRRRLPDLADFLIVLAPAVQTGAGLSHAGDGGVADDQDRFGAAPVAFVPVSAVADRTADLGHKAHLLS